jgi:hypothetical protein
MSEYLTLLKLGDCKSLILFGGMNIALLSASIKPKWINGFKENYK